MKINKSPGSDGLQPEFYIQFWDQIKDTVVNSINEAFIKGELSNSQKRGILTLIYKKNDKTDLSNWRPISLLNTDYKLLAHVSAARLKKINNKIISPEQTGYIKGKFIGQNIRMIQDIIEYIENENETGAVVFLDLKKTF